MYRKSKAFEKCIHVKVMLFLFLYNRQGRYKRRWVRDKIYVSVVLPQTKSPKYPQFFSELVCQDCDPDPVNYQRPVVQHATSHFAD